MSKRKITDATKLMNRWYGGDAEWDRMVLEEKIKARIGQVVYALRTDANLTQVALGEMVGTTQAVISKVENADYRGSALEMLFRVCVALKKDFTVCGPGAPCKEHQCNIAIAS